MKILTFSDMTISIHVRGNVINKSSQMQYSANVNSVTVWF